MPAKADYAIVVRRYHHESGIRGFTMAGSLQDQLLNAGLANKKQAKQAKDLKRKQSKQKRGGQASVDEEHQRREAVEAARLEKIERDRELNRQRQQEQAHKAAQAEVRQLIETHRLPLSPKAELRYNFVHGTTIRHLYLEQKQIDQLARGQLRIAVLDNGYHLIPAEVVERIEARMQDVVLPRPVDDTPEPDDPYADYQIPDDLMW
ncbi:DUF2058 domain-containing protein [Marinobacterium iners]|uniref:DUF2058 domain-containing protein n=1 Tax=Marinobacterium iners TaxID=48076 RepID=UPI001A8FB4D4|nr:DUF2058 domain-containing protein [Marinobacterium iners]